MSSFIWNSLPQSAIYSHLTSNWLILCKANSKYVVPSFQNKKESNMFSLLYWARTEQKPFILFLFLKYFLWVLVNLVHMLSFGFLCGRTTPTHTYTDLCISWVQITGYKYIQLYIWSNFASKNVFHNTWVNNFQVLQRVFITSVKIKIYPIVALWDCGIRNKTVEGVMSLEKGKLGHIKPQTLP